MGVRIHGENDAGRSMAPPLKAIETCEIPYGSCLTRRCGGSRWIVVTRQSFPTVVSRGGSDLSTSINVLTACSLLDRSVSGSRLRSAALASFSEKPEAANRKLRPDSQAQRRFDIAIA